MASEKDVVEVIQADVGTITWHSSEEDGCPDVGVSLTLDNGVELWCGEISRKLWSEGGDEIAQIGDDGGSWLAVFGPGEQTSVVGKVEYHSGRALLELVLAPLLRHRLSSLPTHGEEVGLLIEQLEALRSDGMRVYTEHSEFGPTHYVELAFSTREEAEACADFIERISQGEGG